MHIIFRIVCIGRVYNRKCFHGSLVWLRIENDRFDIIANKQPQLFFYRIWGKRIRVEILQRHANNQI